MALTRVAAMAMAPVAKVSEASCGGHCKQRPLAVTAV